jgi:hypothetical protein
MYYVERTATSVFGTSWRTSLASIISVIAAFIVMFPQFIHSEFVLKLAEFIGLGGLASLGINAKDKQAGIRPPSQC